MPNHFHLICSFRDGHQPGMVLKNIKSFTAIKIIDAIINNKQESRQEGMLPLFEQHGCQQKSNYRYQFWQYENHPILLYNGEMYLQRLNYLHENPVRAGFVRHCYDWVYSSAIDYFLEPQNGFLELLILE